MRIWFSGDPLLRIKIAVFVIWMLVAYGAACIVSAIFSAAHAPP
jgi:hypothetical protein